MSTRQLRILALSGVIFVASFVFRFLNPDFEMEQFIRLVGARQILNGELPDRDFLNRGYTGAYYAAAAAMAVFGDELLGDLVLTASFIAIGAVLTWFLSFQASASVVVACIATLMAVAYYPALYNYPKIVLPVLGLVAVWRYLDHPGVGRLWTVAAAIVVAIVFRHDHGFYLGLATITALACAHLPDLEQFGRRAGTVLLCVLAFGSPYIATLAVNGRLVAHVRTSLWQGGSLVESMAVSRVPLFESSSQPLVTQEDTPISIRWERDLSDEVRRDREALHQLTDGIATGQRTWSYTLQNRSLDRLAALVADPHVEDTHGFDRSTLQFADGSPPATTTLLTESTATAWLYYVTVSLPPLCFLILLLKRLGVLSWRPAMSRESPKMFTAAVYGLMLHQALIRGSLDSRLADVSSVTAVLAAWVMGQVLIHGTTRVAWARLRALPHARHRRVPLTFSALSSVGVTLLATILACLTLWSTMTFGRFRDHVERTGIRRGPSQVVARVNEVVGDMGNASLDWWAPEGSVGLRSLTRYVRACTRENDRLMLTWLEPRPYFFSGRLFSGGMFVFHQGWLSYEDDQRLTVERLGRQSVPIVIAEVDSLDSFEDRYPIVYAHVEGHYVQAAESTFGDSGSKYRVLVDASRVPSGVYEALSLPCYA